MFKKSAAAIAMTAALSFGSAAFAQTMVGSQEVSDADMPAVTAHCETLASSNAPADQPLTDTNVGVDNSAAATGAGPETAEGASGVVDVEVITLAECEAAGLTSN